MSEVKIEREKVLVLFQFHYGAIVSARAERCRDAAQLFQFHYGAIVSIQIVQPAPPVVERFNSTMVRLWELSRNCPNRRFSVSIPLWCDCELSFKLSIEYIFLVSIPLWCDCEVLDILSADRVCSFNSTMVRLWGLTEKYREKGISVSIPLWCDCELTCQK